MEGNQVDGNQVEGTPGEGEQIEPSKGTGGIPGEGNGNQIELSDGTGGTLTEEQIELEQLQQQIKQLEALQGEKDAQLEALQLENSTYKKAIEKNNRKNKIQQYILENNLFECSPQVLEEFAEEENLEKTFKVIKNCDTYIKNAIKKDRETYMKTNNYPPGAGRNSESRGKLKSKTKNIFGFTEQ